jgi:hypothetical protein
MPGSHFSIPDGDSSGFCSPRESSSSNERNHRQTAAPALLSKLSA